MHVAHRASGSRRICHDRENVGDLRVGDEDNAHETQHADLYDPFTQVASRIVSDLSSQWTDLR